jgi:CRISPR-associated protein Csm3
MSKLEKKIIVTGVIETLTGLMIGGTNNSMAIGMPDKMVVRNPVDNMPYIPGSSLKGKMRALLEISFGYIKEVRMGSVKNGPSDDPSYITTTFFGNAKGDDQQRPSRVIFRDARLKNPEDLLNTDLPYTEAKTEVVIDRITSAAMPRQFERVPAGANFDFECILNIMHGDRHSEQELLKLLFQGLQLLQDDYLGGSGSRGSGRIKFSNIKMREKTYGENPSEKEITEIPAQFK